MKRKGIPVVLIGALVSVYVTQPAVAGEVVYETKMKPEELDRYTLEVCGLVLHEDEKAVVAKHVENAKKNPNVVRLEVVVEGKVRVLSCTTLGKLKATVEEEKKYTAEASRRLVIAKDIGPYKYGRGGASLQWGPGYRLGYAHADYLGKNGSRVDLFTEEWCRERKLDEHEFGRDQMQLDWKTTAMAGNVVLLAIDPEPFPRFDATPASAPATVKAGDVGKGAVRWRSGNDLSVSVSWYGSFPQEVVEAYLREFPSNLPKDYSVDKTAWARKEAQHWFDRATGVLEGKAGDGRFDNLNACRNQLGSCLDLDTLAPRAPSTQPATPEEERAEFLKLREWWGKNKDKAVWGKVGTSRSDSMRLMVPQ